MERKIKQHRIESTLLALLALFWTLLSSCDTRWEILDDVGVWVRLEVSWRQAGVSPNGMSIYVFSQETGKRVAELLSNVASDSAAVDSVKLHAGRYSLLAINETVKSHDGVLFRGTDRYHTFEAYAAPTPAPAASGYAQSAEAAAAVAPPSVLAAAHLDRFEVDYSMIRAQACPPLQLTAKRLTAEVEVIVHLKNMHYLSTSSEPTGAIGNLAEGIFLATEAPNATPAIQWFTLSGRAFDPASEVNGTLRATFAIFGAVSAEAAASSNILSMWFVLRDAAKLPAVERDVTGKLSRGEAQREVRLTVEVGVGLTEDDPPIEIPYASTGGSLEVEMGGWGEGGNMEIPIRHGGLDGG
jgi:hypothetical protein